MFLKSRLLNPACADRDAPDRLFWNKSDLRRMNANSAINASCGQMNFGKRNFIRGSAHIGIEIQHKGPFLSGPGRDQARHHLPGVVFDLPLQGRDLLGVLRPLPPIIPYRAISKV